MKFSVAAVAAAAVAGVSAGYSNVTYTTEVVTALTTYCPEPTQITHGGKTYTITKATTLTITDCPCTVSKPVTTSKIVECKTCNQTSPVAPPPAVTTPVGTGSIIPPKPTTPVAAGAGKAALSGAALLAAVAAIAL
ncbi:hypothetical protein RB594_001594 [Gaeumannomyces avenae]